MPDLCSNKTYDNEELQQRRRQRKLRQKNSNNAASGSITNGTIFDLITTPWYHRGGSGKDGNGNVAAAQCISNLLKMYHKLLYAKIGFLDWCIYHMKNTAQ